MSYKDIKALMADLKKVYQAINEDEALNALLEFKEKWQKTYIIEDLNRQFCKITKNAPSFTNDDSLRKILYLASKNIAAYWSVTCRNWDMVSNRLFLRCKMFLTAHLDSSFLVCLNTYHYI